MKTMVGIIVTLLLLALGFYALAAMHTGLPLAVILGASLATWLPWLLIAVAFLIGVVIFTTNKKEH